MFPVAYHHGKYTIDLNMCTKTISYIVLATKKVVVNLDDFQHMYERPRQMVLRTS